MLKSINATLAAFIVVIALSSISYSAELEGEVEIGALMVDTDNESAKFSEYRGIGGDNAYFVGNANISYGKDAYYLDVTGKDLGLSTRNIRMDSGIYGRYNFFLEYDQTFKSISENSKTIFSGAGSDTLSLPDGYDRSTVSTSSAKDTVDSVLAKIGGSDNLNDVDLELERKSAAAGFSMSPVKGLLDFYLSFKREEKEGTKSIGAVVQEGTISRGGVRNTIVLPEPVDYVTDDLKASVAYTREKAQAELAYHLSVFNNENDSLTWENPYPYGASNPVISLPPDNIYHRWTISGGVNVPLNTRLSMVGEYGLMSQDENLLEYHGDPSVISTYGETPRSSAEAEIETKLLNVNLSSRPISPLFVSAKYRHYETVNNTPVDEFTYATADGETIASDGSVTTPDPKTRYNEPYDEAQDKGSLDLSYRIFQRTTLSVGADVNVVKMDERERDRTQEDTYKVGLRTNVSFASAGVNYQNGKRRGDTYDGWSVLDSYDSSETDWINNPDLRKMDISDRDREKVSAFVTFIPSEKFNVGANFSCIDDDFPDTDGYIYINNSGVGFLNSQLGLQDSGTQSYTLDASYAVSEKFNIYVYYTNDLTRSKELGRQMSSSSGTWDDPTYDWSATIMENNDTVGISTNIILGKLTIIPEYTYAKSRTRIDIWGGSSIASGIEPLPKLNTERHTFSITGKYKLTDNVTLGAGYLYENYTSDDWATDGMTFDDTSDWPTDKPFIMLSESEPDYVAHAGTFTVAYKW